MESMESMVNPQHNCNLGTPPAVRQWQPPSPWRRLLASWPVGPWPCFPRRGADPAACLATPRAARINRRVDTRLVGYPKQARSNCTVQPRPPPPPPPSGGHIMSGTTCATGLAAGLAAGLGPFLIGMQRRPQRPVEFLSRASFSTVVFRCFCSSDAFLNVCVGQYAEKGPEGRLVSASRCGWVSGWGLCRDRTQRPRCGKDQGAYTHGGWQGARGYLTLSHHSHRGMLDASHPPRLQVFKRSGNVWATGPCALLQVATAHAHLGRTRPQASKL